jgi:hypothetical protein
MAEPARVLTPGISNEVLHFETEYEQVDGIVSAVKALAQNARSDPRFTSNIVYVPVPPTYYYRPSLFVPNKTSVVIPAQTKVVVNGKMYMSEEDIRVYIPYTSTVAAGKDMYIYAVYTADDSSTTPKFVISKESTYPEGYSALTSRKIGGFHCLCYSVGAIDGHPLSGYITGDIIPASCWDLKHRPYASPEGMVFCEDLNLWVDIYLNSVSGSQLVSVYGGTIADGTSATAFHWYKFANWLGRIGKRMPTLHEFVVFSIGSPLQTAISTGADPGTTGGHRAASSGNPRIISNIGCEDCCGVQSQWGAEAGGPYTANDNKYKAAYDANDEPGQYGQVYWEPNRVQLGGNYNWPSYSGTRCNHWNNGPLSLNAAVRGVSRHVAC